MLSARILWLLKLSALLALLGCVSGAVLLLGSRLGASEWLMLGTLALLAMGLAALWLRQAETEAQVVATAAHRALQLFEAHPDAQLCVTHTGQISRANPAAHALLASGAAPLAGQSVWTIFTDAEPVLAALDKARTRGVVRDMEFSLRRADVSAREVSLSAAVLADDASGPLTLLVTLHETSAARRAERAFFSTSIRVSPPPVIPASN
jgi:PAS domain S-box-containing protein